MYDSMMKHREYCNVCSESDTRYGIRVVFLLYDRILNEI